MKEKQVLELKKLLGDDLFWFTVAQNLGMIERVRQRFEVQAQAILEYFECKRCCRCCREMPVHLNDDDIERLVRLDGDSLFDKMNENEVDNYLKTPCPYLNGNECSIYKDKPTSCRIFPFVVIRPVPTLLLCPLGMEIYEELKRLTRKYSKKEIKEYWSEEESAITSQRLPDYSGVIDKKAVYVALSESILDDFLRYLRADRGLKSSIHQIEE